MVFELNGTTIAGIGAILGALAGAVSFLFKALIESKDATIKELQDERDYWRNYAMGRSSAQAPMQPQPPPTPYGPPQQQYPPQQPYPPR